jgi:hypothetical protein
MRYLTRKAKHIVFLNVVNLYDGTASGTDFSVYGELSHPELFNSYIQQAIKKAINEYVEIESKLTNMDKFLS